MPSFTKLNVSAISDAGVITGTADTDSAGLTSMVMNGVTAPWSSDANYYSGPTVLTSVVVYGFAMLVLGGKWARSRVAQGLEPIGGFIA